MKDYYAILQVPRRADADEIRKQYRLQVIAWHPDKFTEPQKKAEAEEKTKALNEAYAVLSDPARRKRYDRQRRSGGLPGRPVSVEINDEPAARSAPPQPAPASWSLPEYLHYEFYGRRGDYVQVRLQSRANVVLMDDLNYHRYRMGREFRYLGGFAHASPVLLPVPGFGVWHVIVDRGGEPGPLRANVSVIR